MVRAILVIVVALSMAPFISGCKKKEPAPPVPAMEEAIPKPPPEAEKAAREAQAEAERMREEAKKAMEGTKK